jgi:hypothetical protein
MLLLGALAVTAALALRTPGDQEQDVVAASDARSSGVADSQKEPRILPLAPRAATADTKALFATTSWTPPAPRPAKEPPPLPPTAPPLPFKYVGKQRMDEVWEVFLSRGDETLIVREGQTIESSYRIDAVKPPNLTLTYLPLGEQQQLRIGETD